MPCNLARFESSRVIDSQSRMFSGAHASLIHFESKHMQRKQELRSMAALCRLPFLSIKAVRILSSRLLLEFLVLRRATVDIECGTAGMNIDLD